MLDHKLVLIVIARNSWPRYATHDEDKELRGDEWNKRYENRRILQWDNTDIRIPKLSESGLQKATFLSYYGCNCANGGCFIQLCGWMGVYQL